MNECFLIGEIISKGSFKFIFNGRGKNKSVIKLTIKLLDGTIVECKGYDEIADEILRNEYKFVFINGILKTDGFVRIITILEME